jgi:hypothetical protein
VCVCVVVAIVCARARVCACIRVRVRVRVCVHQACRQLTRAQAEQKAKKDAFRNKWLYEDPQD